MTTPPPPVRDHVGSTEECATTQILAKIFLECMYIAALKLMCGILKQFGNCDICKSTPAAELRYALST